MVLLNWMFRLTPGHVSLLMPLNHQAKKGVTVLPGVIEPDCEGEIELLLNKGSKEEYIWNTGDILSWMKVNGKLKPTLSKAMSNTLQK